MNAPDLLRLPRSFFDDHEARDLPTPDVQRKNKVHVWVRRDDPALPELINDAQHYASEASAGAFDTGAPWGRWARTLLDAIARQEEAEAERRERIRVLGRALDYCGNLTDRAVLERMREELKEQEATR